MEGPDPRDQAELEVSGIAAMIAGRRRTYDTSLPWWRGNGRTGEARVPLFVVTDPAPDSSPRDASSSSRREQ